MKIIMLSLLYALGALWSSPTNACEACSARKTDNQLGMTAAPHPVGCTLSSSGLSDRVVEIAAVLAKREEMRELEDGFAFRFPGDEDDLVIQLATWVVAERQCCSFLGFELRFVPDHGPVWLTMRGSQEVKELVASLLEPATDAARQH